MACHSELCLYKPELPSSPTLSTPITERLETMSAVPSCDSVAVSFLGAVPFWSATLHPASRALLCKPVKAMDSEDAGFLLC